MNFNLVETYRLQSYLWMIPEDPPSDNETKASDNENEFQPLPDNKEKIG